MADSRYDKMRHALGVWRFGEKWKKPYRNHFVAGGDDFSVWEGLVADGFAKRMPEGGDRYHLYVVTEEGRQAALAGIVFGRRTWGRGVPLNP